MNTEERSSNFHLNTISVAFLLKNKTSRLLFLLSKGTNLAAIDPNVSAHILFMSKFRSAEKFTILDLYCPFDFTIAAKIPIISQSCEELIFGLLTKNNALFDNAIERGADVSAIISYSCL